MGKKGILARLAEGPVVGDGSLCFLLERRGYVSAAGYTPEVCIQDPEAVKQLHKEYIRAGADVAQTNTFNNTDGRLKFHGFSYSCMDVNRAACKIAQEVTRDTEVLVCGSLSPNFLYPKGVKKATVQNEIREVVAVLVEGKVDFLLAELFHSIELLEWAIEVMKESGLPVGSTMAMNPTCGDRSGVSPGECAIRMAKAGADILGLNCGYDPKTCLKTMRMMKDALDREGLSPYLMLQGLGFHCQELKDNPTGWTALPEYPFALEPRLITRWDARKYARDAYNMGVRYIGGCCGFEPYHIREIADELAPERGRRPLSSDKSGNWGGHLEGHNIKHIGSRFGETYWSNLVPAAGRDIPSVCKPRK